MKKKITSLFLALMICLTLGIFASAADAETVVPQPDVFSAVALGDEITPQGEVYVGSVNIPSGEAAF